MNGHRHLTTDRRHCDPHCAEPNLSIYKCGTFFEKMARKFSGGSESVFNRLCGVFRRKSDEKKEVVAKLFEIYFHNYHGKIFGNELNDQINAVVKFVREAQKQEISVLDAMTFLDVMDHILKLEGAQDMSKDQSPCLIMFMNDYSYSYRIINNNVKTITPDGKLENGTFCIATQIKSLEDIKHLNDFDAMCYIVQHAMEKPERLTPPYCLMYDECEAVGQK